MFCFSCRLPICLDSKQVTLEIAQADPFFRLGDYIVQDQLPTRTYKSILSESRLTPIACQKRIRFDGFSSGRLILQDK
jgi:hypothetical protein